jgi:hypothetical protein
MRNYLNTVHPGVFEPADLNLLMSAYEDAWASVRASATYQDKNFENVRDDLAKHIVNAAIAGERDPVRLRDAGLSHLKQKGIS